PEMRPSLAVAQASGAAEGASPAVADQGSARVSDSPERELLNQTRALQDVAFQKLRQEGLEVQREAQDRFKSGDTDRALEVLQDYLAKLNDTQLEVDRVALLRRPVDARLMQFKTLKAQKDFEKSVLNRRLAQSSDR